MRYRVALAPNVAAELEAAYRYIADRAPSNAIAWYNGCIEAMESLREFPERCALAPESEAAGLAIRHHVHGGYRILFIVQGDLVCVLHIRHGAMRPAEPDQLGRMMMN